MFYNVLKQQHTLHTFSENNSSISIATERVTNFSGKKIITHSTEAKYRIFDQDIQFFVYEILSNFLQAFIFDWLLWNPG